MDSHHADHPGVWLVLHKKGGQTTALTYAQALDEALSQTISAKVR